MTAHMHDFSTRFYRIVTLHSSDQALGAPTLIRTPYLALRSKSKEGETGTIGLGKFTLHTRLIKRVGHLIKQLTYCYCTCGEGYLRVESRLLTVITLKLRWQQYCRGNDSDFILLSFARPMAALFVGFKSKYCLC